MLQDPQVELIEERLAFCQKCNRTQVIQKTRRLVSNRAKTAVVGITILTAAFAIVGGGSRASSSGAYVAGAGVWSRPPIKIACKECGTRMPQREFIKGDLTEPKDGSRKAKELPYWTPKKAVVST
jgi:hypothetical protein